MRVFPWAAAPVLIAAFAPTLQSQILRGGQDTTIEITGNGLVGRSGFARRSSGGFGFSQTRPLGALAGNIGFGYGGSGNFVYRLDQAGIIGLRLGGSMAGYGQERMTVPLSPTIGGRVRVNVTTTNTIGTLSLGPQVMFPEGYIRPYAHVGVGIIGFATTSSVSGLDSWDGEQFATRNYSDGTPTWTAGGGVHIPLSHRRASILLDLGVDYFYGGEASYLRKGSIVDQPNGDIEIHPLQSETRFLNVTVGIRVAAW